MSCPVIYIERTKYQNESFNRRKRRTGTCDCHERFQSPKVDKIYCAPGNAGNSGRLAECVAIGAMEFDKLVAFAVEQQIDLTIIGMDDPWWAAWSMRSRLLG